jgi:CRISPR system Cascade subunit CasC
MRHVALHVLTAYPPSNPNRDEDGQPKTAVVGGKTRQRISSQCIKRAWRLSEPIRQLDLPLSTRTRGLGSEIVKQLQAQGVSSKSALDRARKIAERFGKVDSKKAPDHSEMVIYGHEEWQACIDLTRLIGTEDRDPTEEELSALTQQTVSLDCALFGRMRAAEPRLNVEASVSVSHCLTANVANVDSDFWTAVDDLKQRDEDSDRGSGGMGDVEYGSGVYYTYVDIDLNQLGINLKNPELCGKAVAALIEAIATTTPAGHRSTFAHHGRASYLRAEIGQSSGNLFCSAFESPVVGMMPAIDALRSAAQKIKEAYDLKQTTIEMSVPEGTGSLRDVVTSVQDALNA